MARLLSQLLVPDGFAHSRISNLLSPRQATADSPGGSCCAAHTCITGVGLWAVCRVYSLTIEGKQRRSSGFAFCCSARMASMSQARLYEIHLEQSSS